MSYEILTILIAAAISLLILGIVLPIIIYRGKNYDILTIKSLIKKGCDIENYDVEGREHETKIKALLEENGYVYMDITSQSTNEVVHGLGVAEFKDGTKEYRLYTSKRHWFNIDEEEYEDLKNHIGDTINIHYSNYKWVKVRKDN